MNINLFQPIGLMIHENCDNSINYVRLNFTGRCAIENYMKI